MNQKPQRKKKSYNIKAYKLVIAGGIYFKDSTVSPNIMTWWIVVSEEGLQIIHW